MEHLEVGVRMKSNMAVLGGAVLDQMEKRK